MSARLLVRLALSLTCVVLPEQEAVVVITADTKDMQAELNVVWDHLLPAFEKSALPEDATEQGRLKETCAALKVRTGYVPNVMRLPGGAAK